MYNNVPINSSFENIANSIRNSNYYYLLDSSSNSLLFSEIIQRFRLKEEYYPSNVDSAFVVISKGIRSSRKRRKNHYEPINVTRVQLKFYFNNIAFVDSLYSNYWATLKISKFHIGLLQVGIDSSNATYINEQKDNRNGLKNSELSITKSGIGEKYICISYQRDN
jgi:hypothetical protein